MFSYLPISYLNDYTFCPYSIYLHNVYKGGEEDLYHAKPQSDGRNAHKSIDNPEDKKSPNTDLVGLEVYSKELGLMGKIDVYRSDDHTLIERKNKLHRLYQGHIWQLQAQYLCMIEMGYKIKALAFYSLSDNKKYTQKIPEDSDISKLKSLIEEIRNVSNLETVEPNPNKCKHCIYNNLCDKALVSNIY